MAAAAAPARGRAGVVWRVDLTLGGCPAQARTDCRKTCGLCTDDASTTPPLPGQPSQGAAQRQQQQQSVCPSGATVDPDGDCMCNKGSTCSGSGCIKAEWQDKTPAYYWTPGKCNDCECADPPPTTGVRSGAGAADTVAATATETNTHTGSSVTTASATTRTTTTYAPQVRRTRLQRGACCTQYATAALGAWCLLHGFASF